MNTVIPLKFTCKKTGFFTCKSILNHISPYPSPNDADPDNLRRLRRPARPQGSAMLAVPNEILQSHAPGYLGVGLLLFLFWSRQPDMDTYLARAVFFLAGLFVSAAIISYNRPVRRPLPVLIGPPLVPLLSMISANRFCPAYARSIWIITSVLCFAIGPCNIVNGIRGIRAPHLVSRDRKMK